MDDLLRIGLSNAAVAAVLALAALLVSRFVRRPALAHALWVLVLVKLVTPPLRLIELDWPRTNPEPAAETATVSSAAPVWIESVPEPSDTDDNLSEAEAQLARLTERAEQLAPLTADASTEDDQAAASEPAPMAEPFLPQPLTPIRWPLIVSLCWLGGSGLWLVLTVGRTWRFQRLLRHAAPAPAALQAETRRMARRLRLARCPEVWLLPGRVSPMLWALGLRPRLLLPAGLWPKLDSQQRAALLLHELAHWWRGDHWIRVLELATTCLYWWHPVVWWARRELHEAEEQCCDAWVVWALPGAARSYALALVETLDFLSEARPALPAVASGVGQVPDLRRRLTMIMRGSVPRRLGWCGFLSVAGIGAVLLPLLPTWAQDGPSQEQPPKIERGDRGNQDTERARDELRRLEQEMARMRERISQMEQRHRQARERLEAAENQREDRRAFIVIIQDGQGRQVRRLEVRPGEAIRIPDGQHVEEAGRGRSGAMGGGMMSGMGGMAGMGGGMMMRGLPGGGKMGGAAGRMGGPAAEGGQPPQPGMPMMPGAMRGAPSEDERIRNLERRLEEVLRAVEEMRRDMQRPGAPPNRRNQPRRDSRDPEGANRGGALPEIKSGVIRRENGPPATPVPSVPAAAPPPGAPVAIPEGAPVPPTPSVQPGSPPANSLPPAPSVRPPATPQPASPAAPAPGSIPAAPADPIPPTRPPAVGR